MTQLPDPDQTPGIESSNSAPIHQLPKIIAFESICRCGDEVWIHCDGQVYRLRRTRQNKLILTK